MTTPRPTERAYAVTTATTATTATTETPVLHTDDLAVHFGGIKAVDGISIALAPGKIAGILGPNGSGKSTLLGAITRLTRTTRGAMYFENVEYTRLRPEKVARLGIGRTFQTVRLLDDLTVFENVKLGHDMIAGRRDRSTDAVDTALERAGLTEHTRLRPGELSYGMQRRVEIARAIVMAPEAAAARRADRRHEPGRARGDLDAAAGAARRGAHPARWSSTTCEMMIDTCDHVFAMNSGRLIAEGDARATSSATRPCRRPTWESGRRRCLRSGPPRQLRQASRRSAASASTCRPGQGRRWFSAPTAPGKTTTLRADRGPVDAGIGRDPARRQGSPGSRAHKIVKRGHRRWFPRAAQVFALADGRGEPALGGLTARKKHARRDRWRPYTRCSRSCRTRDTAPPACSAAASSRCSRSAGPDVAAQGACSWTSRRWAWRPPSSTA